jgi:hypothetical protein
VRLFPVLAPATRSGGEKGRASRRGPALTAMHGAAYKSEHVRPRPFHPKVLGAASPALSAHAAGALCQSVKSVQDFSEWIPSRLWRELKIADIGAKPQSHAGPDGYQHHVICGKNRHTKPADEIR